MKKLTAATLNMVLALGIVCLLAGVLFFTRIANNLHATIETWTGVMTIAGAVLFYISLTLLKYAIVFFVGLFSCLSGVLFMVLCSGLIDAGVSGFWPLSVVLAGVCILLTGIAKDRRIRVAFLCPSILITLLGFFFLLFSLDVIKMSFNRWISICWPLIPFLFGLFLIAVFLILQSPYAHFPYDNGENEGEGEVKE